MRKRLFTHPVSERLEIAMAEKLRRAMHTWRGDLAVQSGGEAQAWCLVERYASLVRVGKGPQGSCVEAHDDALPLPEASADLVLLIHRLAGREDARAIVVEAARVLRGEGRLVIVEQRLGARAMGRMRLRRLIDAAGLDWRGGNDFARTRFHKRGCLSLGVNSYAAVAVKRVACARVLRPSWKVRQSRRQTVLQEHGHAG